MERMRSEQHASGPSWHETNLEKIAFGRHRIVDGHVPAGNILISLREAERYEAEQAFIDRYVEEFFAEAQAPKQEAVVPEPVSTPAVSPDPRAIPIFPVADIIRAEQKLTEEKEKRLLDYLLRAKQNEGYRLVPQWRDISDRMEALRANFPNFADAWEVLESELVLAAALPEREFRVSPMLWYGSPGIGKTLAASKLADALGVPFAKISAGGAQGPFDIVGTSMHWSNSHPGRVFELLALGEMATGVLLIDEVDKIHQDERFPVIPALLDLLERDSAQHFRDESFGVVFDASKLIIILTANAVSWIPEPLMSRAQSFEIATPSVAQRAQLISRMVGELAASTGHTVKLEEAACQRLAANTTMDLRELQRVVRLEFSRAMTQRSDTIRFQFVAKPARQSVGFL